MDRRDSLSLRLVCRQLSAKAAAQALSHLPINLRRHNYTAVTEKLEAYALRKTPGAFFARTVSISSLAHMTIESKRPEESGDHSEFMLRERDKYLRELLPSALRALNIRVLEQVLSPAYKM